MCVYIYIYILDLPSMHDYTCSFLDNHGADTICLLLFSLGSCGCNKPIRCALLWNHQPFGFQERLLDPGQLGKDGSNVPQLDHI